MYFREWFAFESATQFSRRAWRKAHFLVGAIIYQKWDIVPFLVNAPYTLAGGGELYFKALTLLSLDSAFDKEQERREPQ